MVNSHEVARLAGVSQPTVSRALRDSPKVSAETKRKVRAAAAELGYVPSDVGRALSEGRSRRIAMVLTDLENQFYPYLIAPMHDELGRLGYQLLLMTGTGVGDDVADRLAATSIDGAVLATTTLDSPVPQRLQQRGVPFVYLNRTTPGIDADSVVVDPSGGYQSLVQELFESGHRRVGIIFGPANTTTAERRESMIRRLIDDTGLKLVGEARGSYDVATGEFAARQLLEQPVSPTVIICANDLVAVGALNAATALGVPVPDELSVVGFDDLPLAGWSVVQLASIGYDVEELSRTGARTLVDRLEKRLTGDFVAVEMPSHLSRRRSLGPGAN